MSSRDGLQLATGEWSLVLIRGKTISYGITVLIVTYMHFLFINIFEQTELIWVKCVFTELFISLQNRRSLISTLSISHSLTTVATLNVYINLLFIQGTGRSIKTAQYIYIDNATHTHEEYTFVFLI